MPGGEPTIELTADPRTIAGAWDELADRVGAGPFARPEWHRTWWSAFGLGTREIVCAHRDGRLVGVLPLARSRGRARSPTNEHTPAFEPLADDAQAGIALVRAALGRGPRELDLAYVDRAGAAHGWVLAAAREAGYRVVEHELLRSPWVDLEAADGPSARRGRQLGRMRRRLCELGELRVDVADDRGTSEAVLAEAFAVEGAGWKRAAGTAIDSRPDSAAFYADLAVHAAARGELLLRVLRLDGRAIAMLYGLQGDGVAHLLKGGYEPAYGRHSPGQLLLHETIADARERGLRRVELLGGDERYKLAFAGAVRERVRLQAFRPTPLGSAGWALEAWGRPLARRAGLGRLRLRTGTPPQGQGGP